MSEVLKGYTVRDKRGENKGEPKLPCRVCGCTIEHSIEYNKPTMECINYLKGLIKQERGVFGKVNDLVDRTSSQPLKK